MCKKFQSALFMAMLLVLSISYAEQTNQQGEKSMLLQSSAFTEQGSIPKRYTCDGENVSPPLSWSDLPANTKSLVLIVDDPDAPDPAAPKMTWVHWLLYNIPPTATQLPEAVSASTLPKGTLQGKNDWKKIGYGGPCPPIGQHRYIHKLYALNNVLPDLNEPNKARLEQVMGGHILAHYQLIGTYQRF
jgi:Raf kinase inhibitor-like YbhB/YbcL family protein